MSTAQMVELEMVAYSASMLDGVSTHQENVGGVIHLSGLISLDTYRLVRNLP